MNDHQASFRISPDFVIQQVWPTLDELTVGVDEGWISYADIVAILLAKMESRAAVSELEERVALLLSDEIDSLPGLLGASTPGEYQLGDAERLWIFLATAWVMVSVADYPKVRSSIDALYADFGYPVELEPLVSYMPAPPGKGSSQEALEARWRKYVAQRSAWYKHRARPGG